MNTPTRAKNRAPTMQRRQIFLSDDLWGRARIAAAKQGKKEGRTISTSEYIREALEERLRSKR